MEQHPVPQHIASYEFRLVGDMTLRQFAMLGGCCFMALLFYASGLPAYFKWPIVLFFITMGFALAFLPLQERPLHQWIMSYLKTVYSPTQYVWQKTVKQLDIFEAKPKKLIEPAAVKPKPTTPKEVSEFIQTLPEEKGTALDFQEDQSLQKIDKLFDVTKAPAPPDWSMGVATPVPQPMIIQTQPVKPRPVFKPMPAAPRILPQPVVKPVAPSPKPQPAPPKPKLQPIPSTPRLRTKPVKPIIIEPRERRPAHEAKLSPHLPFPQAPRSPNLLVGMILSPDGKIVENAIIEIRNESGMPVRALKTNKLGQFRIVTPLKNGLYEIETEKEGFDFDIIKIRLEGKPVKPIEIRAK